MHLVEILLPLQDNDGKPYDRSLYDDVRNNLATRFGGVTTFMRSPATGVWKKDGETVVDEIVVFEVMVEQMQPEYWRLYRVELQKIFRQEVIPVRSHHIDVL